MFTRSIKFFWVVLVLYVVMSGLLLNPDVPLTNDGPYYFLLAQSIVSQQGYRDIFHPDKTIDVEYPPFYPLFLAFILVFFPETIVGLKIVSILFGMASLIAIYILFSDRSKKYAQETKSATSKSPLTTYYLLLIAHPSLLLLLTATNLWFLSFSTTIAPEIAYLFFSLFTLISLKGAGDKKDYFNKYLFIAILGTVISCYIKSIGFSLIFTSVIYFIIKRQWRKGFFTFIFTSLTVLPWIIRNKIVGGGTISQDYINQFLIGHGVNLLNIGKTIFYNVTHYVRTISTLLMPGYFLGVSNFEGERSFSFLYSLLGKKEYFEPQSTWLFTTFIIIFFASIVCIGFVNQLKRKQPQEIYVLCYLFILFLFPKGFYLSSANRYFLPLLPFILYYFLKGIFLFETWRQKIKRFPSKALKYSLGFAICFILLIANLVPAFRLTKGNISYLANYKFLSDEERKDYHSFWGIDYFTPATWIKKNTSLDSIIMHCFPPAFYIYTNRKTVFFLITPTDPWQATVNSQKRKSMINRIETKKVDYLVTGHRIEREIIDCLNQDSEVFIFVPLVIFKTEMKTIKIYKVVKVNLQMKLLDKQGMDWYKKQDYKRAILEFDKILKIQPNLKTYFDLGQCYEKKGLYKKAIMMYKQAVQLEPTYEIAKNRLRILRQKEKIKQNPDNPSLYYELGKFYLKDLDLNRAIENFKYALWLDTLKSSIHYNLGLAYLGKKKYTSAIEEFETCLKLEQGFKYKYKIKHYIKIAKLKLK